MSYPDWKILEHNQMMSELDWGQIDFRKRDETERHEDDEDVYFGDDDLENVFGVNGDNVED